MMTLTWPLPWIKCTYMNGWRLSEECTGVGGEIGFRISSRPDDSMPFFCIFKHSVQLTITFSKPVQMIYWKTLSVGCGQNSRTMQLCQYMNSCKHSLFNFLSSANMIIFSNLGKWCLVWPNANNEEMSISRRIDGGKLVPVCLSFVHYRSMGALLGDTGYIFGKWEYILGDRRTWQSVFHICACFNYFGPKLPKHHKHGNIRSTTQPPPPIFHPP